MAIMCDADGCAVAARSRQVMMFHEAPGEGTSARYVREFDLCDHHRVEMDKIIDRAGQLVDALLKGDG